MCLPLKKILGSVETLISEINEQKNKIVNQIKDRDCVSPEEVILLLDSFVNQIVEQNDVKPDQQLIQRSQTADPHRKYLEEIKTHKQINEVLRKKLSDSESHLKIETNVKNYYKKLYENSVKSHLDFETALKQEINDLKNEIIRYKELEQKLRNEIMNSDINSCVKNEVKQESIVETNHLKDKTRNQAINDINNSLIGEVSQQTNNDNNNEIIINVNNDVNNGLIDSDYEVIEEPDAEEVSLQEMNGEQELRNLCLKSNSFVYIESIQISDNEADDVSEISETDVILEDIREIVSTESDLSDDGEVTEPVTNSRKRTHFESHFDQYSEINTRSGTKYICNASKCNFNTKILSSIVQHIRINHQKFSTKVETTVAAKRVLRNASQKNRFCRVCDKVFDDNHCLELHMKYTHKQFIRRSERNRDLLQKEIKAESIEQLVDLTQ